jgi:hypothetical protein
MHFAALLGLAGGIIALTAEASQGSRLGAVAWLCVIVSSALRINPTSIPMSDWIEIALATLFIVLMLVRFVVRRKSVANSATALPR